MILIGIDPHKSSHTAVAVDAAGQQLAQRRFVVNAGTFRQLMRWCQQWPERRFAVEGAGGLGRRLAQQLAAAGENVVDVPATVAARARLLATGARPQDRRRRRPACRPRCPVPPGPAPSDARRPDHDPATGDRAARRPGPRTHPRAQPAARPPA
ncbi:MAG TPA: transposase [Pseudonocardiaceae bacterium]